ncbi:YceI family protein [Verrucomicrobium sp. BvORR034]|uniref:YceI family protein n=1 Tax=Verrucomicrobium sp. BvORR034 TaxID=1396418 RepID=UPI0006787E6E|nr:YceI family protein [Verrucomicrobium sp. BvORR034]
MKPSSPFSSRLRLGAALFSIVAWVDLAIPAMAGAETETQRWTGVAAITFSGTSTLHNWSGQVKAEPFTAQVTMDDRGNPTSLKSAVQVKAASMDTDEPKRDENMRKAMRVTDYPLVTAAMNTPFSAIAKGGSASPVQLPLTLNLVGKAHDITGTISAWEKQGDTATFELDFDLSLKKCGITVPPALMILRVGDTVKVHALVKLVRKPA